MKLLRIFFIFMFFTSPLLGQQEDQVYHLLQLTDSDLLSIDINDGSIEDWVAIIGEPTLTAKVFGNQGVTGLNNDKDIDYRIWAGWHQATSRIYLAMERIDNIYINEYIGPNAIGNNTGIIHHHDSALEVAVDGDNSGGIFWDLLSGVFGDDIDFNGVVNGQEAQEFVGIAQSISGQHVDWSGDGAEWIHEKPYADGGGGVRIGPDSTVTVTEFYITPFDVVVADGPDQSLVSRLSAYQVIGMGFGVPDFDLKIGSYKSHYVFPPLYWPFWNADDLADFILIPKTENETVVQSRTWGQVKFIKQ